MNDKEYPSQPRIIFLQLSQEEQEQIAKLIELAHEQLVAELLEQTEITDLSQAQEVLSRFRL